MSALFGCGGGGGGAPAAEPPVVRPTATLSATNTRVLAGLSTVFIWSSVNATNCTASGAWSGTLAASGSQRVAVSQSGVYSLTCNGAGGASDTRSITVDVPLAFEQTVNAVQDAVWNPAEEVLYLAFGSNAFVHPNSVVAFDPIAGDIRTAVLAGSEPVALAMSQDGVFLYVGFRGSDTVNRYILPAMTLDATFAVDPLNRNEHEQPKFANQLAVAPGMSSTLAVSTITYRTLPAGTELQILDNGVPRARSSSFGGEANSVAWGHTSGHLFVTDILGDVIALSANSPILEAARSMPASTNIAQTSAVTYFDQRLYDGRGRVFDAATVSVVGNLSKPGLVTVDDEGETIFVATWDALASDFIISSYDLATRTLRDSIVLEKEEPARAVVRPTSARRIMRFGEDGIAIVGSSGDLNLLRGSFVKAGAAAGSMAIIPGTDPCCIDRPLLIDSTITATSIRANDIVWDATNGLLLASIAMDAPSHASSIALIDPLLGVASVFVPTEQEPGALAVTDDGQYLYVATALKLQRFRLPSLALDATANLPDSARKVTVPEPGGAPMRLSARPDDNRAVAIDGGTIMRDMVPVPMQMAPAHTLRWSGDGSTVFGLDGISDVLWSNVFGSSASVTALGTPFFHPFPMNAGTIAGATFYVADDLLYSETGAVFDPTTGGWPGTLPFGTTLGTYTPTGDGFALGPVVVEPSRRRAYSTVCAAYGTNSVCGNTLIAYDLDSYLPVAVAELPSVRGWAYGLQQLSPTSFAILTADREIVIVEADEFTR